MTEGAISMSTVRVAIAGVGNCANSLDDDLDGWPDAEDPDCASGDQELGLGTSACPGGGGQTVCIARARLSRRHRNGLDHGP